VTPGRRAGIRRICNEGGCLDECVELLAALDAAERERDEWRAKWMALEKTASTDLQAMLDQAAVERQALTGKP